MVASQAAAYSNARYGALQEYIDKLGGLGQNAKAKKAEAAYQAQAQATFYEQVKKLLTKQANKKGK